MPRILKIAFIALWLVIAVRTVAVVHHTWKQVNTQLEGVLP